MKKIKPNLIKLLSFVLAVLVVAGTFPIHGGKLRAKAAGEEFCVQVVRSGAVISSDESFVCSFANTDSAFSKSGTTGANGVWKTGYNIGDAYDGDSSFTFSVGEKSFSVSKDLKNAEIYLIYDADKDSYEWASERVTAERLISVADVSSISGLENRIAKTAEAFGLPETVQASTTGGNKQLSISWNVDGCSYNASSYNAQTFTVQGTVALDENTVNPDNVSLTKTVQISVNGANDASVNITPYSASKRAGERLTLTATAANAENGFVWYKDGKVIAGETSSTLVINSITAEDEGKYKCSVVGLNGTTVYSDEVSVSVNKISVTLKLKATSKTTVRPIDKGITLSVSGIPEDATGSVKFYANGKEIKGSSGNSVTFTPTAENKYTFKAEFSGDSKYSASVDTASLTLTKGTQAALTFKDTVPTEFWTGNTSFLVRVNGGSGDGDLVYSIVEQKDENGNDATNIARATTSGTVFVDRAGEFKISVVKKGDDDYNDSTALLSGTVKAVKREQSALTFAQAAPSAITYGENGNIFANAASGGSCLGDIVYSVDDENIAQPDSATPSNLIIKKSGTVVVTACRKGNNEYLDAYASYTLTVEKADQELEFASDIPTSIYYGQSLTCTASEKQNNGAADGKGYGDGEIVYSIVSGENIASVDEETGVITFSDGKLGSVSVKAVKAECDCYNEAEAIHTFEVKSFSIEGEAYTISGEKKNDSGWYTGNVTVTSDSKYTVSTSNSLSAENVWSESVTVSTEGENNGLTVYFKDTENGAISEGVAISSDVLKIDKSKPSNLQIIYSNEFWWEDIAKSVLFGTYDSNISFTVKAKDEHSGVANFAWSYDKSEDASADIVAHLEGNGAATAENDNIYSATFTLPITEISQIRGKISFTATDTAGWSENFEDTRLIVIDTVDPTVSVSFEGTYKAAIDENNAIVSKETPNARFVYAGNVTASITVKEENFWSDIAEVTLDETNVECTWNKVNGEYKTTVIISGDGEHTLKIKCLDAAYANSENKEAHTVEETHSLIIDATAPVITVGEPQSASGVKNSKYYSNDVTVDISVTEEYFNAEMMSVTVNATDASGNAVSLSTDYDDFIKEPNNWIENDGSYTATLTFTQSAIYNVTVGCKDYADLTDNTNINEFVIDKTAPQKTDITITYNEEDIVNRLANILYSKTIRVTITASDDISGIDYINWSYAKATGASETNVGTASGSVTHDNLTKISGGKYSATVSLPKDYLDDAQFNGSFSAEAFNMAGLGSDSAEDEKQVIVDSIAPGRSINYGEPHIVSAIDNSDKASFTEGENVKLFYSKKAELKLVIDEANFYAEDFSRNPATLNGMNCKVTAVKNSGTPYEITPTQWESDGDNHTGTIVLEGDGEYVLTINYNDRSGNAMQEYVTPTIVIDSVKPVIRGTVSPNAVYTTASRTVTVTVEEQYFRASDFVVAVNTYDFDGNSNQTTIADEWTHNGNSHTVSFTVSNEARYGVTVNGCDLSLNNADEYKFDEFVIDKTAPEIKSIEYKVPINEAIINSVTFGYFNPTVDVTVTAHDAVSGIAEIMCSYTKASGASTINEDSWSNSESYTTGEDKGTVSATFTLPRKSYDGFFSADATDKAQNTTVAAGKTYTDGKYRVVVDSTAPKWLEAYVAADMYIDANTFETLESVEGKSDWIALSKKDALIRFKIDEANFYSEDFNAVNSSFKNMDCSVTLTKDGGQPYAVTPEWQSEGDIHTGTVKISGDGDYRLNVRYSDRSGNAMVQYTSPIIAIDSTKPVISATYNCSVAPENGNFYKDDVAVTVKVEERYFRPEAMKFSLVKATDVSGNTVEGAEEINKMFAEQLCNKSNWSRNGSINTATIVFTADANYEFTLDCADIIGNIADTYASDSFTVDKTLPDGIIIEYSTPIQSVITNVITFYYNPTATITVTARDSTSGIDSINWRYDKLPGASDTNVSTESGTLTKLTYSDDGKSATGSFTLPYSSLDGQYNGNITATAVDRAGNHSLDYRDDGTVVVIDTISPTREVEFSPAKQVVKASDYSTYENYNYLTEGTDFKVYYDSKASATIRITEANFFPEDVNIKVNGAHADVNDWAQAGDVWSGTLTFESDGHYVITIEYTDRSRNEMKSYISNEIIVDTVDPVIKVTYSPDKVIKTIDNRKYYDEVQRATITITEHNFRASDIAAVITAADISGSKVNIEDFAEYLKKDSSWSSSGDVHTATITYSADANYTFDIDYTDLALRKAEDYQQDDFSVDTTPPDNLKITYSTSVLDTVINSVSFSFYNTKVRATISAKDVTSGVGSFKYSYVKAAGVSSVNTELIDQEISESGITYSDGGKTATAYFDIPRQAVDSLSQFRGTAKFSATDRAGNASETLADNRMLVVDNIAPVANVSFNQPANTISGTAYYSGDIVASIDITEANFYPEDVHISVNGNAVSVGQWAQKGDKWSNTLTVSSDGEYKIAVSYKDRSGNAMTNYESGQLVIDRTKPVITVSGIKNESANKGEKIGFRISASDTNFDISEFKPQLTAVVRNENGVFASRTIDTGAIQASGDSYYCVVDNLNDDAIYTLTCKATDRAGNANELMTVTDSGNAELASVSFSVNRNGSTFMLDEYTQNAVDKYYLGSVDNNIVVIETNVDPLTSHEVKLNQKTLIQGTDYTVTRTGGGSSWYKYTYEVNASLFENEGEYSLVVSSVDKAETMAFSDIRNAEISFLVDKTAPEVVVSGIAKDGRYQTAKQLVTIIPTDEAGQVYAVKVLVKDKDGNVIATPIDLSGTQLVEALEANENKLTFELGEGMYQNVEIICIDKSGNEFVSGEEYFNVTISPSGMVILWANPVFKWSLFGVGAAAAAGVILVVILKKKKKEKSNG